MSFDKLSLSPKVSMAQGHIIPNLEALKKLFSPFHQYASFMVNHFPFFQENERLTITFILDHKKCCWHNLMCLLWSDSLGKQNLSKIISGYQFLSLKIYFEGILCHASNWKALWNSPVKSILVHCAPPCRYPSAISKR